MRREHTVWYAGDNHATAQTFLNPATCNYSQHAQTTLIQLSCYVLQAAL